MTLARVAIHATTDTDAEHIARQRFAKLDPEPTDDEIRSACPNPAIDPDRIREHLRTEARP